MLKKIDVNKITYTFNCRTIKYTTVLTGSDFVTKIN